LFHAIEVAFESVDVGGPKAPERSEPRVEFHERFRLDPVDPPLRVHSGLHKAGVSEHPEVLGDRRLWHSKLILDLAHGPLRGSKQAQDGPTVRFRDNAEGRFHYTSIYVLGYMPVKIYIPLVAN
jgi:hypothetical protein